MSRRPPGQKLTAAAHILADALVIARRRAEHAASVAELVDAAMHQQLLDMIHGISSMEAGLDESLADLSRPPTGP